MTEQDDVVLTLPAWAVALAGDLLAAAEPGEPGRGEEAGLRSFRYADGRFAQLDVAAALIERRLPFDARVRQTANGWCRSSERKVRFDAAGALREVTLEDMPRELNDVYIGLLQTVESPDEHAAVSAFLQPAGGGVAAPLHEAEPLPEQIEKIRAAEEADEAQDGTPQRRIM